MDKRELQRRAGITEQNEELEELATKIAASTLDRIKSEIVERHAAVPHPGRAALEIQYVLEKVIEHMKKYA